MGIKDKFKERLPKKTWLYLHNVAQFLLMKFALRYAVGRRYEVCMHKTIDWEDPKDLNEKVLWLMVYSDTSRWPELADKYGVREYVEGCGLGGMLNELYGVWNDPRKIDFDALPNKYVLKCNNGCGDAFIVRDGADVDKARIVRYFQLNFRRHHGIKEVEPHYLKIKPRVIAEELLEQHSAYSSTLIDYKFYCFYGEPACVLVCYNRKKHGTTSKIAYDMDFTPRLERMRHICQEGDKIPAPASFHRMIEACRVLGRPFPFVRIDFYDIDGKAYFGEMTFTPAAGHSQYLSDEYMVELGNKIDISKCRK